MVRLKSLLADIGPPLLWVLAGMVSVLGAWTGFNTQRSDFQMLWSSAHLWWAGADPYSGPFASANLNPPIVILVLTPLGCLSAPAAFAAWTVCGWICAAVAARLIAGACPTSSALTVGAIALISVGGATATASGQVTWPLLLIVTLGWLADRRRRGRATGIWVGILIAAKLFFGLWLADLVARRARQALLFAIGVGLVLSALGLIVHGLTGYASWVQAINRAHWAGGEENASMLGLWVRVLPPSLVGPMWAASLIGIAAIAAAVVRREPDIDSRWAALMFTALLLSPLGWIYYVPLGLGPLWALHVRGVSRFHLLDAVLFGFWCVPYRVFGSSISAPAWANAVWINRYTFALLLLWTRVLFQIRYEKTTGVAAATARYEQQL